MDVLEGGDDPDLVAGRIALVGVVGQGLVDYQLTPNGERLPGVEVHAEVIENIFGASLLRRPEAARGIEVGCFALLALMAAIFTTSSISTSDDCSPWSATWRARAWRRRTALVRVRLHRLHQRQARIAAR